MKEISNLTSEEWNDRAGSCSNCENLFATKYTLRCKENYNRAEKQKEGIPCLDLPNYTSVLGPSGKKDEFDNYFPH